MGNHANYPNPNKNPYVVKTKANETRDQSSNKISQIDFDVNRICPSCGKVISLKHNFCKFCGVDLAGLQPMQTGDRTVRELAKTALTDPNADVRKDAVSTLGEFGEYEVLGVLAYILLNDLDESVRKEAAEELGDLHHIISLDVLAKALKDRSPIVRKEAIEGLKKIKEKNKPQKREFIEEPKAEKHEALESEEKSKKIEVDEEEVQKHLEKQDEPKFEEQEKEHNEDSLENEDLEIEEDDDEYYKL
jgi:HEAT repeat protein